MVQQMQPTQQPTGQQMSPTNVSSSQRVPLTQYQQMPQQASSEMGGYATTGVY